MAVNRERFADAEQNDIAYVLDVSTPAGVDLLVVQAFLQFLKFNYKKLFARALDVNFPEVQVAML